MVAAGFPQHGVHTVSLVGVLSSRQHDPGLLVDELVFPPELVT